MSDCHFAVDHELGPIDKKTHGVKTLSGFQ